MLSTLRTLANGFSARTEEGLRDVYSVELIDQKVRESDATLKGAKITMASLIQRERAERRQIDALQLRIEDLTARAKEALEGDREDLAGEAAIAIAQMENEATLRRDTHRTLETRVLQMRHSIETATRRVIDLKQGAKAAKAVHHEQTIQRKFGAAMKNTSAMEEAEDLIARVMQRDDPFEHQSIMSEIDQGLSGENVTDRLASEGFGPSTKTTASDVLARLKS